MSAQVFRGVGEQRAGDSLRQKGEGRLRDRDAATALRGLRADDYESHILLDVLLLDLERLTAPHAGGRQEHPEKLVLLVEHGEFAPGEVHVGIGERYLDRGVALQFGDALEWVLVELAVVD